jgi:hypothetical protein
MTRLVPRFIGQGSTRTRLIAALWATDLVAMLALGGLALILPYRPDAAHIPSILSYFTPNPPPHVVLGMTAFRPSVAHGPTINPHQSPPPAPTVTHAITALLWLWTQTVAELALLSAGLWLAVRHDRHALLASQQGGSTLRRPSPATLSLAILALAVQALIIAYPFFLMPA